MARMLSFCSVLSRFFYSEIERLCEHGDDGRGARHSSQESKKGAQPPPVFEWVPGTGERRKCQLRAGLEVHLYISQPPCAHLLLLHFGIDELLSHVTIFQGLGF